MLGLIAGILIVVASLGFSLTPSEERQLLRDIAEIKATLKTFMEQTDRRFKELREDMNERFRQVDKRITELREDMNERFKQIDKRFEQVDKRFEQIDKRFEQVDKRFEQINRELDRLVNIIVGVFAGQIALVGAVIGFAWWDRRTVIRKAKEETFEEMEKEIKPEKFRQLLNALREKANTDKELAKILKQYGLL